MEGLGLAIATLIYVAGFFAITSWVAMVYWAAKVSHDKGYGITATVMLAILCPIPTMLGVIGLPYRGPRHRMER